MLIGPLMGELAFLCMGRLQIEKLLKVTEQLQGTLDYLLSSQAGVIVVEANRQDLAYGMTQLAAEMIALDKWDELPEQSVILGGVSIGEAWQFATLNRQTKLFHQNIAIYAIPDDRQDVIGVLLHPLTLQTRCSDQLPPDS